jgi:23S rRNA-/tRNA-specific pseudouridylate synthase
MSRDLRVWQVQRDGPRTLGAVLEALGVEAASALAEGRVWVSRARADDANLRLAVGERVEVHAARKGDDRAWIVARDAGFVVAYKPALLPTEPDRAGHQSLTRQVAELISVPQVHAVSRLDVGVSGLVLLAEGREARQRGAALREAGSIARRYVAIAECAPPAARGTIAMPVDGRSAETSFAVVAKAGPHGHSGGGTLSPVLLALDPVTGRKHQLRHHFRPLLGDRAHGGTRRVTRADGGVIAVPRIMLHAARVALPWGTLLAPAASDMVEVWCALGGAADDLERAASMG